MFRKQSNVSDDTVTSRRCYNRSEWHLCIDADWKFCKMSTKKLHINGVLSMGVIIRQPRHPARFVFRFR